MKLREKLKSYAMDNHFKKYGELNAKNLEKITDEFTISFTEWIIEKELFYSLQYGRIETSELLLIFKKDKGL